MGIPFITSAQLRVYVSTVTKTGTLQFSQTAKVRSNTKGNLAVTRLPKGVIGHRIVTIKVDDANGQRVLNAHF